MMLIMNLASVAVVWYGALAIGDGRLAIGNMMAFLQYALQVIMSFLMISMVFYYGTARSRVGAPSSRGARYRAVDH